MAEIPPDSKYRRIFVAPKPAAAVAQQAPRVPPSPGAAGEAAAPKPEAQTVALLMFHGIGQQVPFATIDMVARLLRSAMPGTAATIETRLVKTGGSYLPRAEISLDLPTGRRHVHIYEAYWAPLTAGKVSLLDVAIFLLRAGYDGLARSWPFVFRRLMFGNWQVFSIRLSTIGLLALVAAVFAALAWMSIVIVAVTAARSFLHAASSWPEPRLMTDLTLDLSLFLVCGAVLAALYGCAFILERMRDRGNDRLRARSLGTLVDVIVWIALGFTVVAAIAAAILMTWHLAGGAGLPALLAAIPWLGPLLGSFWTYEPGALMTGLIWAGVFLLNLGVRAVLVDYLGDVAAYIAAHTVSKFREIRQAIHECARKTAEAVFASVYPGPGSMRYDRVIFAGHSLGSVVAYDTLNALLLNEALGIGPPLAVHARVSHLITFGSPLDKTAFIFREQQPLDAQVREALASNVQPLIRDYANRARLTWINLWSHADLVSGHLDYYDEDATNARSSHVGAPPRRIDNRADTHSTIPLMAHVMYWQSPLLADALLEALK